MQNRHRRRLRSQAVLGPVAGLAARGQTLVAGFSSGALRFYSLPQRRLWMEVQAHSRFLSCLALHPRRPMFATAAEDATIHVWEMPDPGEQTQARPRLLVPRSPAAPHPRTWASPCSWLAHACEVCQRFSLARKKGTNSRTAR